MVINLDTAEDVVGAPWSRDLEDASDSLARLDTAAAIAPRAFGSALWFAAVGSLADAGSKGTRFLLTAFAAGTDHPPTPPAGELETWRAFLEAEERRVRGGAPVTATRLFRAPSLATQEESPPRGRAESNEEAARSTLEQVENALRYGRVVGPSTSQSLPVPTAATRPAALTRAIAVAAGFTDRAAGEAAAALVLVAEGRTDRIRLLPFADVASDDRVRATRLAREGDDEGWRSLALEALVRAARRKTQALARATEALASEEAALDSLGRAAITARRTLALLRTDLACTVPSLSVDLDLSRPAAGDALERLTSAGVVAELTGRRRDRAFAYAAALAVADA